jgi:hypothetical protein
LRHILITVFLLKLSGEINAKSGNGWQVHFLKLFHECKQRPQPFPVKGFPKDIPS